MHMLLVLLFSILSFGAESSLSGTPRFIRGTPQTEVFFKDLKDSFIIPNNDSHNRILKAFMDAQKSGKSVSFKADIKNRIVLDLGDSPVAPAAAVDSSVAPTASTTPIPSAGKPNN